MSGEDWKLKDDTYKGDTGRTLLESSWMITNGQDDTAVCTVYKGRKDVCAEQRHHLAPELYEPTLTTPVLQPTECRPLLPPASTPSPEAPST